MTGLPRGRNRAVVAVCLAGLALQAGSAAAQTAGAPPVSGDVVKIGVLNDLSGLYSGLAGMGSVEAARMAIEEVGGTVLGKKVELVFADHQNKADVGATVAREWFDRDKVDVIVDFSNSGVGLAVQALAKEKNRITLITAASSDFTGKACTPTSAQWVYNSRTNGYGLARSMTERGLDSWFLITVDYAFGHAFSADIRKAVADAGGKVVGEVRHPLNTPDVSSFLLQAQSSNAKVVAIVSAGADMTNAVKQAAEFGLTERQALAAPIVFLNDVHAMGTQTAQGLQFLTAYYWDRDDASRAWAKKFQERRKAMPTMVQSGVYSAVRHYLRGVEAAGTDEASAVMTQMRKLKVDDPVTQNGWLRADGQMMHDMFLVEVKKPSESKGPWDYYKVISTVPAESVFQPLSNSDCPLVKG